MTKYPLLLAGIATLSSCNFNRPAVELPIVLDTAIAPPAKIPVINTPPAPADTTPYVDSFAIQMDSLMTANIVLPPIYRHEILSSNDQATQKFSTLAQASRGKMRVLVNAGLVAQEVMHTVNTVSVPGSDLLLLIDKTTSMADDIEYVKEAAAQIVDSVRKHSDTRLAVALYGDKTADGMGWYHFKNFETDYDAAQAFISGITVEGGGAYWEESVYEAIMESLEQPFWESARKRNIILIGDAPPFEKPTSNYSLADVISKAKAGNTVMNFYPIIITPTVEQARVSPAEVQKYKPVKLATALYPNPSVGRIDVGFEENGTYYMEIYDATGQVVVSEETYGISWGKNLNVPDGMYILRIINQNHKFELIKFIVRH